MAPERHEALDERCRAVGLHDRPLPDRRRGGCAPRGLSQLLVPLRTDGIAVRPIRDLAGNDHFCEVIFTDAVISEDSLIGAEGGGWAQVMAELAYERSRPERLPLVPSALDRADSRARPRRRGGLKSRSAVRWRSSRPCARCRRASPASSLRAGTRRSRPRSSRISAACTSRTFPASRRAWSRSSRGPTRGAGDLERVLAHLSQNAPSFSLRGGTREILRGIIARGLGLR